jgi:nitrite reductase/ring-hydroxylating ferredoxin subunit
VRVRILGEDLVAFRDTNGDVGLFPQSCPHRGASLFFGRNEECGLRCVYHGWKFDVDGNCVDMPSEPAESNFKNKVKIAAYPTHESGGLVWAYMGPREKMQAFRDFGSEGVPRENWRAFKSIAYCNWVQRMEGNIDTSHISWLHQYEGVLDKPDDGTDRPGYPSVEMSWRIWRHDRAPRLEVHDTWYGYRYAGIRTTPRGNTHVRITAWAIPYTSVVATIPFGIGGGLCVPIDDESCYFFFHSTRPFPNPQPRLDIIAQTGPLGLFHGTPYAAGRTPAAPGERPSIPGRDQFLPANDYRIDRELQKTTYFSGITNFQAQDLAMTESPGAIWDRSKEHLGTTDKAIIRMRSILLKAAKDLMNGIEPPCTDPSLPYTEIRSGEKILAPGEDWRLVGSNEDPVVQACLRPAEEIAVVPEGGSS